ncbi:MAG: heme-binding protein [Candidatus Poseidoniales archaeon]
MAETLEEPAYEVISTHDGFEVRRYAPTVQARVQTAGRDGGAASGGFRRVAGYIFGGNSERASIAMTAPVHMWEEGGSGWLAFTMPSAYALETLPSPNDAGVRLHSTSVATVAVARFSGRTTPKKTARVEKELRAAIEREGYVAAGPAVLAVYENPWTTLPFMRRNELHIELLEINH